MTPSARPSPHPISPLQPSIGRRSTLSRRHFLMIASGYILLFVSLAVSFYWNVKQARERQAYIEISFALGFERGGEFVKSAIERAFAARERADALMEARQHAEEESDLPFPPIKPGSLPTPTPEEAEPPL